MAALPDVTVCAHGSIRRVCPTCELIDERDALLAALKGAYGGPDQKAAPVVRPVDLRDRFAGQALIGYYAGPRQVPPHNPELVAEICYRIADAMLAERAREHA